ncbi:MAG: hypothetical protein ACTTJM_03060 [Bergeyella cardium]
MQITALHNQSTLDVCLQHTGSIEGVFELAMANSLSLTDELQVGTVLQLPKGIAQDRDILSYYTAKSLQPACGITPAEQRMMEKIEGISYWVVGYDFKIS